MFFFQPKLFMLERKTPSWTYTHCELCYNMDANTKDSTPLPLCYEKKKGERERGGERERQTETERDRETDRQRKRRQPVKYNLCSFIFSGPARLYTTKVTNMKTEDMTNMPRVRIAVLGKINVGKSGKNLLILLWEIRKMGCSIYSINIILYPSNLRILTGRRTFVIGNNTDEWRTQYNFTLCRKRGLCVFCPFYCLNKTSFIYKLRSVSKVRSSTRIEKTRCGTQVLLSKPFPGKNLTAHVPFTLLQKLTSDICRKLWG